MLEELCHCLDCLSEREGEIQRYITIIEIYSTRLSRAAFAAASASSRRSLGTWTCRLLLSGPIHDISNSNSFSFASSWTRYMLIYVRNVIWQHIQDISHSCGLNDSFSHWKLSKLELLQFSFRQLSSLSNCGAVIALLIVNIQSRNEFPRNSRRTRRWAPLQTAQVRLGLPYPI